MTDKADFKKSLDSYQATRGQFRIVEVPDLQYLMIDGHGDPNTSAEFADAVAALFPLAYALKFASKRDLGRDYVVMPLEGLWSADDMDSFTTSRAKSRWAWTLMVMVPDWIDREMYAAALQAAEPRTRRGPSPTYASRRCRRGPASVRCTSARSTTRPVCSRACTTSSSPSTAWG